VPSPLLDYVVFPVWPKDSLVQAFSLTHVDSSIFCPSFCPWRSSPSGSAVTVAVFPFMRTPFFLV